MLNAMYGHTYSTGNWIAGVCTLCKYKLLNHTEVSSLQTVASAQWLETALWGNPKLELDEPQLLIIHRGVSRHGMGVAGVWLM